MLFEDGLTEEMVSSLRSLEEARLMGVDWPYNQAKDEALIRKVMGKYPQADISKLVDRFLVWCLEEEPENNPTGRTGRTKIRLRFWTWVEFEVGRFSKPSRGKPGRGIQHYPAMMGNHGVKTEVLDTW